MVKIFESDEQKDKYFMSVALKQAKKGFEKGEIPVGVVIVKNNEIISRAYNKRNESKNALEHAEMIAISKACKKMRDWRLTDLEMYVTLLPCPMCAGAIVNARIKKVIYGAVSENLELFEKILSESALNHKTDFSGGVLSEKCTKLLQNFFEDKRHK